MEANNIQNPKKDTYCQDGTPLYLKPCDNCLTGYKNGSLCPVCKGINEVFVCAKCGRFGVPYYQRVKLNFIEKEINKKYDELFL